MGRHRQDKTKQLDYQVLERISQGEQDGVPTALWRIKNVVKSPYSPPTPGQFDHSLRRLKAAGKIEFDGKGWRLTPGTKVEGYSGIELDSATGDEAAS